MVGTLVSFLRRPIFRAMLVLGSVYLGSFKDRGWNHRHFDKDSVITDFCVGSSFSTDFMTSRLGDALSYWWTAMYPIASKIFAWTENHRYLRNAWPVWGSFTWSTFFSYQKLILFVGGFLSQTKEHLKTRNPPRSGWKIDKSLTANIYIYSSKMF